MSLIKMTHGMAHRTDLLDILYEHNCSMRKIKPTNNSNFFYWVHMHVEQTSVAIK